MLDIGGWYLTMFDKPMFQFAQGIVIGVLIMGAIWLLHKGTHEDVQKEVMRTMTALKCDRCGTLYERDYTPDIRINKYTHPYGDEWIDLCPKCQQMLEKWLNGASFEIPKKKREEER